MPRNDMRYLQKLADVEIPHGYRLDTVVDGYPCFVKTVSENQDSVILNRIRYSKRRNGLSGYLSETYIRRKIPGFDDEARIMSYTLIFSDRFSLKKMLSLFPE